MPGRGSFGEAAAEVPITILSGCGLRIIAENRTFDVVARRVSAERPRWVVSGATSADAGLIVVTVTSDCLCVWHSSLTRTGPGGTGVYEAWAWMLPIADSTDSET